MASDALLIGIGPAKDKGMGKGKSMPEDEGDTLGSSAKAEAGQKLASALGIEGEVDGTAICEAVKAILELESYESE